MNQMDPDMEGAPGLSRISNFGLLSTFGLRLSDFHVTVGHRILILL